MLWIILSFAVITIIALALFVIVQTSRFERRITEEARELWSRRGSGISARSSEGAPFAVRRYLEASGALRRAPVRTVCLKHGGTFRTAPTKSEVPIRGIQYFSADVLGFVWWGRIRIALGLWIEARDKTIDGNANMLVRIASIFTLYDVRGSTLDHGTLQRLLAEMVWFPTAFADERYVTWTAIDDTAARANLHVGAHEVNATFHFGEDGLPQRVTADRYCDKGGQGILTPWVVEMNDFRDVDGLKVPFRCSVSWIVDGKPFEYACWQVEHIEFDRTEPF